jgi:hypothetical protein
MARSKLGLIAALIVAAVSGCADGGVRSDDAQSFLGISRDIRAVFSSGTSYMSPLRAVEDVAP